jgi:hypothetical protein
VPAVDWAAAWMDLTRRLGEKPHWGTDQLYALLGQVPADHEVPEDLMQRALRLNGGSYTIQLIPEPGANLSDGSPVAEMQPEPGSSHDRKGDHDVTQHHRSAAA